MRVATAVTATGTRIAVHDGDGWRVLEDEGAPRSVDALVRGGDDARARVERGLRAVRPLGPDERIGLCVPVPQKLFCIGVNYRRHAAEMGRTPPDAPMLFSKFASALTPAGEPVRLIAAAEHYDYEAELCVVIGRGGRDIGAHDALQHVWGYCNCNDLSARDLQYRTSQFLLGKMLDGFLPVGPQLVSADEVPDPQRLRIRSWLNGEPRQDSTTADMIVGVADLIAYISTYVTLEPGDLIATGTPEGVIAGREDKRWMRAGDVVEVEVEGLGRLVTPLVAAAASTTIAATGDRRTA